MWLILLPSGAPYHRGNLCTLWRTAGNECSESSCPSQRAGRVRSIPHSTAIAGCYASACAAAMGDLPPARAQLRFITRSCVLNKSQTAWARCGWTQLALCLWSFVLPGTWLQRCSYFHATSCQAGLQMHYWDHGSTPVSTTESTTGSSPASLWETSVPLLYYKEFCAVNC